MRASLSCVVLALLLAGPALAGGKDIDKLNGAITTTAGEAYGTLETVNGSIRIEDGVEADYAETVNGSITVGDKARLGHLETVNGSIRVGSEVEIAEHVETVNGAITIGAGGKIGDRVETVNGGIRMQQAEVKRISTVNGDIEVGAGSHVRDGIVVERSRGWNPFGTKRVPKVTIGANARVDGKLVFKREVELRVHPSAVIGAVEGAKVLPLQD